MRTSERGAQEGDRLTLGCFEVGGRVYALDVSEVREVVRWQPVTPLPHAPELVEGVIDLRGSVVPIIDLGRVLGGEPVPAGPRARIAIAESDGLVFGLAVESAVGVLAVDPAALHAPPALVSGGDEQATRAVVRRDGVEPILLLSVERLVQRVRGSARPPGDGA